MTAGHGPNIGHGYVKYVVIDPTGKELPPVVFPAMIARAGRSVSGALHKLASVYVGSQQWWIGDDAQQAPSVITRLSQDRLTDPVFIPALLQGALARLGHLNGASTGACVTGLPAMWAQDATKAKQLGSLLRSGYDGYERIKVIAEPLGLVYSALLNGDGQITGDLALMDGQIAVVDLGHLTVDLAVIRTLAPVPSELDTFQLGTSRPLGLIRAHLSSAFDRELSLHETDQAVRAQCLRIAGTERPLPDSWDRPLLENAEAIAARLVDRWGPGAQFDAIVVGGGGAELPHLVAAIQAKFAHAFAVDHPQTAIARGYARLARRIAGA